MFTHMVAEFDGGLTFDTTGFHHNIEGREANIISQIGAPAVGQLNSPGKMLLDVQNSRHVEPIAIDDCFG